MHILTGIFLFISAIALTIGVINLQFWLGARKRFEFLAIACTCIGGAVYAWFEIVLLHLDSPQVWGEVLRWSQIPACIVLVSLVIFLQIHLGAGRRWLAASIIALRIFATVLTFIFPVNIHFHQLTEIRQTMMLGEMVSYAVGVPNPWGLINQLGFLLLIIYCADTMVSVFRRGEVRKAIIFCGSVILLALTASTVTILGIWTPVTMPALASPALLFVIIGLEIEMAYDIRRSSRLARKLAEREAALSDDEESLHLLAAADAGLWKRDLVADTFTATDKWHELFGFVPGSAVRYQDFIAMIDTTDRERVESLLRDAATAGTEFATEYRITLPSGKTRWIGSIGRTESLDGKPRILRGVSIDITKRKRAEESAHDLSRKLMGAQEKERARIARELHDDLSQSLALLSIEVQTLAREPGETGAIRSHIDELTERIQRLSSDVHRISHELHPSKLSQLGLEAALRGFCRENDRSHGLKIRFEASDVPRALPNDLALCIYRIAQEAVQNAIKHSGASFVNVDLCVLDDEVRLAVSDNGCGFDPDAVKPQASLGLISMAERINLVNGTLTIESFADSGTQIKASVPLNMSGTAAS